MEKKVRTFIVQPGGLGSDDLPKEFRIKAHEMRDTGRSGSGSVEFLVNDRRVGYVRNVSNWYMHPDDIEELINAAT